ncbi:CheR family methyltransferase [Phosphitispora fastidiosa]|uniref:CheR family methyltransferase n=1 Tax=Phosphitispora fastidiosa TaxID=2837202 RepID=UPI001E606BAE|nr:protein-glutamate O-methyltransferase CheR [Phosphitispora fastidiosa]MBU7006736.1 chemotaxis protein methyltransferase CheR [Phosphitispora fastidiosa]
MADAYETFLDGLRRKKGLDLTGYKRPQMERRINSLMRSLKITDYGIYLGLLEKEIAHWRKFLDTLTINVSEFYRNPSQWQVLEEKILPELIQASRSLKIWSAGCSTGEEPYTLTMVMMNRFPHINFTMLATDVDDEVLNKARTGVYNDKAVLNLPQNYINGNFTKEGSNFKIKDEVKKRVNFMKHNLLTDAFDRNFDLILCRNVVIYFTEESKAQLYRKFYTGLKQNGILFTGSTEQIFQAREIGFSLVSSFFYKKGD